MFVVEAGPILGYFNHLTIVRSAQMPKIGDEVDRNYTAFVTRLPELMRDHPGQFALLHDTNVVALFTSALNATIEGSRQFGLGSFSVQEITQTPENLGFYSYVGGAGAS